MELECKIRAELRRVEKRIILDNGGAFEIFRIVVVSDGMEQELDLFSEEARATLEELVINSIPLPCYVQLGCSGRLYRDRSVMCLVVAEIEMLKESANETKI